MEKGPDPTYIQHDSVVAAQPDLNEAAAHALARHGRVPAQGLCLPLTEFREVGTGRLHCTDAARVPEEAEPPAADCWPMKLGHVLLPLECVWEDNLKALQVGFREGEGRGAAGCRGAVCSLC